jgi:ABC-type multidrug transport system permease subunit
MLFRIGTDATIVMSQSAAAAMTTSPDVSDTIMNNYYGAISLMILISLFGKVEGVSVSIPAIRSLFLAEHGMARLYGIIPFLFSQAFIELPLTFFMAVIQVSIAYWIIGFAGNFFIWIIIVFTASVATSSIGWLIASISYSSLTALQLVPVIILPQILFSGLLIDIQLIPSWMAWMEYLCYLKYCINIAFINEVYKFENEPHVVTLATQNFIDMKKTGAYVVIIVIFIIGARLLAAIALYYSRKIIAWKI